MFQYISFPFTIRRIIGNIIILVFKPDLMIQMCFYGVQSPCCVLFVSITFRAGIISLLPKIVITYLMIITIFTVTVRISIFGCSKIVSISISINDRPSSLSVIIRNLQWISFGLNYGRNIILLHFVHNLVLKEHGSRVVANMERINIRFRIYERIIINDTLYFT